MQLFDSWAGALSERDYREFVLPHSARVLGGLADAGVPRIHFGVGTGELLGAMAEAGADVVGVDWRVPLDEAARRAGGTRAGAGQPRPGGAVRRPGVDRGRGAPHRRRGPAAPRATCSTSGHGVLPGDRPGRAHPARRAGARPASRDERPPPGRGRRRRDLGPGRRAPAAHAARPRRRDHRARAAGPDRRRAAHRRPGGSALRRRRRGVPGPPARGARSCSTSSGWPARWCTRPRPRPSVRAGGRTVPLPGGTLLGVPTSRRPAATGCSPRPGRRGGRRARPPAALGAGRRRRARRAAAGALRRRAGRPAGRPAARRRLRRPGGRARPARHRARPGRGPGRGRALADRGRRPAAAASPAGPRRAAASRASCTAAGVRGAARRLPRAARRPGRGRRGRAAARRRPSGRWTAPPTAGGSSSARPPPRSRSTSTRCCSPCPRPRSARLLAEVAPGRGRGRRGDRAGVVGRRRAGLPRGRRAGAAADAPARWSRRASRCRSRASRTRQHQVGAPRRRTGWSGCAPRWAGSARPPTLQVDDAELVARVRADLATLAGITADPVAVHVQRWGGGLPQYARRPPRTGSRGSSDAVCRAGLAGRRGRAARRRGAGVRRHGPGRGGAAGRSSWLAATDAAGGRACAGWQHGAWPASTTPS